MSDGQQQLVIPRSAAEPILAEVTRYGTVDVDVETGGFLLAAEGDPMRVTTVGLAGARGVVRHRGLFSMSGTAIDVLFEWADDHALRIPAQVHSHRGEAFLSPVDRREGFNVTGFISCVVPFYNEPPEDPQLWGWWRFEGQAWVPARPPQIDSGKLDVVTFDEDGVRRHE